MENLGAGQGTLLVQEEAAVDLPAGSSVVAQHVETLAAAAGSPDSFLSVEAAKATGPASYRLPFVGVLAAVALALVLATVVTVVLKPFEKLPPVQAPKDVEAPTEVKAPKEVDAPKAVKTEPPDVEKEPEVSWCCHLCFAASRIRRCSRQPHEVTLRKRELHPAWMLLLACMHFSTSSKAELLTSFLTAGLWLLPALHRPPSVETSGGLKKGPQVVEGEPGEPAEPEQEGGPADVAAKVDSIVQWAKGMRTEVRLSELESRKIALTQHLYRNGVDYEILARFLSLSPSYDFEKTAEALAEGVPAFLQECMALEDEARASMRPHITWRTFGDRATGSVNVLVSREPPAV
ncbi:hypothetical protein Esti_004427 [Eimeria stiedai]